MKVNFPSLIATLDREIRQGQAEQVRAELRALAKVPREYLADVGHLALRVDLPGLTLRLLQRVIAPKAPLREPRTARETAVYAAALAAVGALSEAKQLLSPVAGELTPEVQLHLGFINVYQWDYAAAIPYFQTYMTLKGPTEYQKVIAQVNLAAAFGFCGRKEELHGLVEEILRVCATNEWHYLRAETLIIQTQALIAALSFDEAKAALEQAARLVEAHGLDSFYLNKWSLILALKRGGASRENLKALVDLRKLATERSAYETVRECDYYRAIVTRDSRLAHKTFFGTSFPAYRRRLLQEGQGWLRLRKTYRWQIGAAGGATLNLSNESSLPGGLVKLLRALSSDFYRPLKIGDLFSRLYPDEAFNPFSSPGRVRSAISRGREQLQSLSLNLAIDCEKNEYRLVGTGPVSILTSSSPPSSPKAVDPALLRKLRTAWPYKAFTTEQASNVLSLPIPETRDVLKKAVAQESVIRLGTGRATLFRLAKA